MDGKIREIQESAGNHVLQEDLEWIVGSGLPLEKLKGTTVLVTGATGLIGSLLVRTLACCNRLAGTEMKVLAMVRRPEKARAIFGEMLDRPDIVPVCATLPELPKIEGPIDYIIHGAGVTASRVMIEKPVETIVTAVDGTGSILRLGVEKKVKSVVYLSSMEVYGSLPKETGAVTEEKMGYLDPLAVRSNYPLSKRMCENLCAAYYAEYGLPVKIARLAQTFGAGILPGENRVFAQFADSVRKGTDIVLHTKGKSEGNYCYTRDAVRALLLLLTNGENGEAYNISNEETHRTIAEMAELVAGKIAENRIRVVYDIPLTNRYGYAADTRMKLSSKKMRTLGWEPGIGLEEAYRRMIQSMNETEAIERG